MMTKRQFVVLVFRLFALYLLYNLISQLGTMFSGANFLGHSKAGGFFLALFGICVTFAAIAVVWWKSEWLMQKIFAIPLLSDPGFEHTNVPDIKPENLVNESQDNAVEVYYEQPLTKESVELIAFSVLGMWIVFNRLPALIASISFMLFIGDPLSIDSMVAYLVEAALGLWLFLRPWQFQRWIEKFKPKAVAAGED